MSVVQKPGVLRRCQIQKRMSLHAFPHTQATSGHPGWPRIALQLALPQAEGSQLPPQLLEALEIAPVIPGPVPIPASLHRHGFPRTGQIGQLYYAHLLPSNPLTE